MNLSEEYAEIGARLIRTLPEFEDLKDAPLSIAYLSSDKQKKVSGRLIFGECKKVSPAYEWCCPFEFMIIIYDQNIAGFNQHQLETLIRHELHHVGIRMTDTGYAFYIVPHDREEFDEIIAECGIDWSDVNG